MKGPLPLLLLALLAGCAGPASSDEALLARARKAGVPWEAEDIGGVRPASPWLAERAKDREAQTAANGKWKLMPERKAEWLAARRGQLRCEGAADGSWPDGCSMLRHFALAAVKEAAADPPALAKKKLIRARESAAEMLTSSDFIMVLWGVSLDQEALLAAAQRSSEFDIREVLNVQVQPSTRSYFRIWSWHRVQIARNAARRGGIGSLAEDRKRFDRRALSPMEWLTRQVFGRPRYRLATQDESIPFALSGWPDDPQAKAALREILRMDSAILRRLDDELASAWRAEEAKREANWSSEVIVARWSAMADLWTGDLRGWQAARIAAERAAQGARRAESASRRGSDELRSHPVSTRLTLK